LVTPTRILGVTNYFTERVDMTEAMHDREPARGEEALLDALVQTSYAVVNALTVVGARQGLSLTLLRVLAILRDRTPAMSELATYLGLDRSSITGLVDRAEARGLIHRESDEKDRRSSRVALTESGRRVAQSCADEIARELGPMIALLDSSQRDQLTRLLRDLGVVDALADPSGTVVPNGLARH
jgi:MarR family transcriptional regulator, lower aerobic nicotinate degradation pathway regulator